MQRVIDVVLLIDSKCDVETICKFAHKTFQSVASCTCVRIDISSLCKVLEQILLGTNMFIVIATYYDYADKLEACVGHAKGFMLLPRIMRL